MTAPTDLPPEVRAAIEAGQEKALAERDAALAACAVLAGLCQVHAVSPSETEPHRQHIEQGFRVIEQARLATAEECAAIASAWGNAPPNPNGRRAKLAAAIRASFGIGGEK